MIILVIIILILYFLLPTYVEPVVFTNFLSAEECDAIKSKAENKLETSTVGQDRKIDKNKRDSKTAWLSMDDPVVRGVVERCLKFTDRPMRNCEKLQVLKYDVGGKYEPHQDVFSDTKGNKRLYTFILALNDEYEGGETLFPNIEKKYKLNKGDALFFHTLDNYELMTSKALHGGSEVTRGEKWICNLWIHKFPTSQNSSIQ